MTGGSTVVDKPKSVAMVQQCAKPFFDSTVYQGALSRGPQVIDPGLME